MRGLALVAAAACGGALVANMSEARADTATLAGIATPVPADARKAIAIGPTGQVYAPDGKGAWVRTKGGGTADDLVSAVSGTGTIVADAKGAALFRLEDNGWTSIRVVQKGSTILGAGTRLLAAAGKSVFAIDGRSPTKLADAPLPVLAVAGTVGGSVVVSTAKGLFGLQGSAFKLIKNAPRGATLLSDRFLLVSTGVFDLKTQKTLAWPTGLKVTDTTLVGPDMLMGVGVRGGKTFELVIVKASGTGPKKGGGADTEAIPLPSASPIVGLVGDKAGRVVVATRDGHIAVRDGGKWTVSVVSDALPADKPGPAPATSP